MRSIELARTPHAPGIKPVSIHYREFQDGKPMVILHGGWGYGVYPFDRQIEEFSKQFRILIPDRSGYGHSSRVEGEMPLDFHQRAALETFSFLDALGIERAVFWGHSDGAVIVAMMGLAAPQRCAGVILEAFHFFRGKPRSRSFFERFSTEPGGVGDEMRRLLVEDHGEEHWQTVLRRNCGTWLKISDGANRPDEDLYDGLPELRVPALFLHGSLDPRTEPEEMDQVGKALPRATIQFLPAGKHSPHCEYDAWQKCNKYAREFLEKASL